MGQRILGVATSVLRACGRWPKGLVTVVMVAGLGSCAAQLPDRADRAARLQQKLVEKTNEVDARSQKDPGPVEVREMTNGSLVAAGTGNYAQAERMFRLAYDEQNMMPGEHLGEMPWHVKKRTVHDANSIDFATECLGPLLIAYAPRFNPAFQKYMHEHAQAALVALANHKIPVTYSNIYTMNFSNQILIGEALHDEAAAQRGYKNMDNWLDYTGRAGLHEFDSPTYNSVVLSALMMVYQYSSSAHARQKAAEALKYVWTDLAANYFAASKKMAGAKSRDYNFLYGTGNIDCYYFWQGFQDDWNGGLPLERVFLLEATKPSGYWSDVKPFPADVDRVVSQRYDEGQQKYRYTFVTPEFAMGIANGNYDAQDKMFALDFASGKGGKGLPNVYLATTATGLPYGQDKSTDKSGHSKPHHLKNNLGAVQDKGLALMVADPNPRTGDGAEMFYVDMVFPAAGTLTMDGKSISSSSKFEKKLGPEQVFGLHIGDTCVGVKVFTAEKSSVALSLKSDELSLANETFRLTAVVNTAHGASQVGYLVKAERCKGKENVAEAELKAAVMKQSTDGGVWTVDATVAGTKLSLDYDLKSYESKAARVNDGVFTTPTLKVDLLRENQAAR